MRTSPFAGCSFGCFPGFSPGNQMAVRTFSKLDAVATSLDAFAAETTSQADLSNSRIASQRDPKDSPFAPQADMNDSPIESRSQRSVNDPAILSLADLNESGIALQWFEASR